jgi:branched-chain amino acid transport system ATP-binding protein
MTAPTPPEPLLDVAGLRVTYGGVVAVSDVDLRITEGTIYGLIGPNGAGKTSMVDALTGYTRPAAGRITFNGRDIGALRPYRRARLGLARTFQSVELFDDLTVEENLLVASEHVTVASALRDLFGRSGRRTGPASTGPSPSAASRMSRAATRRRSRWAGASWSASAGRSPGSPAWSCWTSPRPGSTPTRASSWGAGCAPCPKSTA